MVEDPPARSAALPAGVGPGLRLRAKAKAGTAIGTFVIEHPSVATVRTMASAGFDFVVIDMEHSGVGFESLESLVSAAHAGGIAAIIRVWSSEPGLIGKALESGANGVMVPHVETVAQVYAVVKSSRFPPVGERSFSPLSRYDTFHHDKSRIDDHVIVIVQVEGPAGLMAVQEIAALTGIDGVFIGPHDFAGALGVRADGPEVRDAARRLAAAMPSNVLLGIYADDPAASRGYSELGFNLQCLTFDGRLLADAARDAVLLIQGHSSAGLASTEVNQR